jgi:hypothetical protein
MVGSISAGHALRMDPVLLLGALAGAQTATAAMAAVQDRSGSPVAFVFLDRPMGLSEPERRVVGRGRPQVAATNRCTGMLGQGGPAS